ncbi:MBL fold metallo-hydrolase [Oleispira antarctica]|uniref:MBL fold metallo-hydrolase n=1 Tax=Oleispira antarctica TaxID=188908 RepID=A0A1Y5HA05_OLEAN|nr:MBL fold metallo-hydrolase [Oleispira antarctica]
MTVRNTYLYENGPYSVHGFRTGRFDFGINTTFIIYRIGETLIDAGPTNQWSTIKRVLKPLAIKTLLITHHHEDHSGNANRISKLKKLTPYAPLLGQDKLAKGYPTPLIQKLIWGSPLKVQTQTLPESLIVNENSDSQVEVIAIPTPGHAKDLTCLFLPEQKYLFSGDMYISKSLKYLRADENLTQLIDSLRKLIKLDFEILFCPHRGIVEQGKKALEEKLENLLDLCNKSQKLMHDGLDEEQIVNKLLGPEDGLAKMSKFNISKGNLIRQAMTFDQF